MTQKQIRIVSLWEIIDEDEPDISTEQLMERVCHIENVWADEVAEALEAEAARNPKHLKRLKTQ